MVVEKTSPHTFITKVLWGVDVLAVKNGEPILAIQVTSGDHVAHRIEKLKAAGFVDLWKSVGAILEVWGWSKAGPRGARKVWTVQREAL
jgi:hypothetical protein